MKKMSGGLKLALSVSDEIYKRYDALMADVARRQEEFERRKSIAAVILQEKGGSLRRLQVVRKFSDAYGTYVIVK